MTHDSHDGLDDGWTCKGMGDYPGRIDAGDVLRDPADPEVTFTVHRAPFPGCCEWRADDICQGEADFALFSGSTMTLGCRSCVEADKRDGLLTKAER